MHPRLPVTLVGGFLGAGKTSLLHHLITGQAGGNLAVLVASSSSLNLDAQALRGLCGSMRRLYDTVIEIPDDDEEKQVVWMAEKLRELALAGRYERVFIEDAAIHSSRHFGRYFGVLPGDANLFGEWAQLQQIICVVDALDLHRSILLPGRKAVGELADFQAAQIEGASLIVLNKCDLVEDDARAACVRFLLTLNPEANLTETAFGEIPREVMELTAAPPQLTFALGNRKNSGGQNYAAIPATLSSLVYRAYRPFHPERFWAWFNNDHAGLLRVKGLIWLATRNLLVGGISRTRWQNSCGSAGIWWAALPREDWPEDPEALRRMQETWREPYGDRRQELVLIGSGTQLEALLPELNDCMLSELEYSQSPEIWTTWPDPFPAWDVE